ncbi:MAG: rhomboid family intramembrane serine protease [Hyphomicrobium aestuarii]|nr:rhomboid family intramembrane serine protease [Hyphomicrobium aestuarii]
MTDGQPVQLRREPFLDVPAIIVWLTLAIIAVHVLRQIISPAADDWLVGAMGFVPLRYDPRAPDIPGGLISAIVSPVTHFFIHGDVTHLLINVGMLLAFGGFVARRGSALRVLAFIAVCSAAGAGLFYLMNTDRDATMIGASGGISGLMAAALRLMFSAADAVPMRLAGDLMRRATPLIPLKPLRGALADPRIQTTTGLWFAINLLAAFGLGTPADAAIAWEAHIGGYVAGLFLFGAFDGGARPDGRRLVQAGDEDGDDGEVRDAPFDNHSAGDSRGRAAGGGERDDPRRSKPDRERYLSGSVAPLAVPG